MEIPGQNLLAGTALAADQDCRIGRSYRLRELQHIQKTLRLSDRAGHRTCASTAGPAYLGTKLLVLHPDLPELAGPSQNRQQVVIGERLLQVVEGAGIDSLDGTLE